MSEDEDEAFLMGLALGGDDGLAVTLMGEDEDYERGRKHRQSSSGNEFFAGPTGIIRVLLVLVLLGFIIWLVWLII